jgi:hypothetical protein
MASPTTIDVLKELRQNTVAKGHASGTECYVDRGKVPGSGM